MSICIDGKEYETMTLKEFDIAIATVPARQPFCYFIGELARACELGKPDIPGWEEMKKVARAARRYEEQGHICLTQRRAGPFKFEYLATIKDGA
jgi:hypothetical protein